MTRRKFLFALRSAAHTSYHRSTLRSLAGAGHSIELVFPTLKEQDLTGHGLGELCQEFPSQIRVMQTSGRNWNRLSAFVVGCRELRSLRSYLGRPNQSPYYRDRWRGNLLPWSQRLRADRFLSFPGVDWLLRMVERVTPADASAQRILKESKPDVVVASPANLTRCEEVEFLKAAQRMNIATAISVLSWDNLTTKGIFPVQPDLLLVWNESHAEQAITIHQTPAQRLRVIGSPFFDKWWEQAPSGRDRSLFLEKVGLNPSLPYVLYLGSSPSVELPGASQLREWISALRSSEDRQLHSMQVLVRPHPSNAEIFQETLPNGVAIWPPLGSLPDSAETLSDFYLSVQHAVVSVGLNTTAMVDVVAMDRPCICLLSEACRATQAEALHFRELLQSGALEIAHNASEAAVLISRRMKGAEDRQIGARAQFVRKYIRPHGLGIPAGHLASAHLQKLAEGWRPELGQVDRRNELPLMQVQV